MARSSDALSRTFAALADPTRRRMVDALTQGPLTVGQLAGPLSMSLPGVSKHIGVLEHAGIVTRRRLGRTRRVELRQEALLGVARWTTKYQGFWSARMDALDDDLSGGKAGGA